MESTVKENLTAVVLSSGGKDSILALHLAMMNKYHIKGIITVIPEDNESMLYHTHNITHVKTIAKSIGIEWYPVEASTSREEGDLINAMKNIDFTTLVTGGVCSNYQRVRFERIARSANKLVYSPIWGMDETEILRTIVDLGFDTIVVAVAALGLEEEWLGRHLNNENVEKLLSLSKKYRFSPVGEGGDYDTFVLDAPPYRNKLKELMISKEWKGDRGRLQIIEMSGVSKV